MAAAGASTERQLRARLGAAELALAKQKGVVGHAALSRVQARVIIDLVQQAQLAPGFVAEISDRVLRMEWYGNEAAVILDALSPNPNQPTNYNGSRRRPQQDYLAIYAYFPDDLWDVLCSKDELAMTKLEIILAFSLDLGLRLPSEPSLKMLSSIWMMVSEPAEKLSSLTVSAKFGVLQNLKLSFDRARKLRDHPIEFCKKLPTRPADFLQEHQQLYTVSFKYKLPAPCRIDERALLEFDNSYPCRNGHSTNVKNVAATAIAPATPAVLDSSNGLQLVANMFLPMMQTLQLGQQRMMDSIFERSDSLPGLRSLSALGPNGGTRRQRPPQPLISILPSASAMGANPLPAQAGTLALASGVGEGAAAVGEEVGEEAAAVGEEAAAVGEEAEEVAAVGEEAAAAMATRQSLLLDMLDERDQEKKEEKKAD